MFKRIRTFLYVQYNRFLSLFTKRSYYFVQTTTLEYDRYKDYIAKLPVGFDPNHTNNEALKFGHVTKWKRVKPSIVENRIKEIELEIEAQKKCDELLGLKPAEGQYSHPVSTVREDLVKAMDELRRREVEKENTDGRV